MTLSYDKNTPEIKGHKREIPIRNTTTIYAGSLVLMDASGFAASAKTVLGHVCVGIAEKRADGPKGDTHVVVKNGVFGLLANSNEQISSSSIGKTAYVVDEETVSISRTGKSTAGEIFDVSGDLVWIKI